MKFDVILMNPPYDNQLGDRFLTKIFELCKGEIVTVQPANSWLLGAHQKKKITEKVDEYKTVIETINGNDFFDAGIAGILSINYINMLDNNRCIIFDGKEYNKCIEINKFSNDICLSIFKNIVQSLAVHDNLQSHLKYEPSVKNISHAVGINTYIEENPNINWWCLRIGQMQGDNRKKGAPDFFTLFRNNMTAMEKMQGQYKDLSKIIIKTNAGSKTITKKYFEYYFAFNTSQELTNFINYCKTDFLRTSLYLVKNHMNLLSGMLYKVPWFDFSNEHFSKSPSEIDDYLFDKFNISDEIRQHIEEILPDYYEIRKG